MGKVRIDLIFGGIVIAGASLCLMTGFGLHIQESSKEVLHQEGRCWVRAATYDTFEDCSKRGKYGRCYVPRWEVEYEEQHEKRNATINGLAQHSQVSVSSKTNSYKVCTKKRKPLSSLRTTDIETWIFYLCVCLDRCTLSMLVWYKETVDSYVVQPNNEVRCGHNDMRCSISSASYHRFSSSLYTSITSRSINSIVLVLLFISPIWYCVLHILIKKTFCMQWRKFILDVFAFDHVNYS